MSQRQHSFVPGEFYHIYNRGTDKRVIFQNETDYKRFQALLYILNTSSQVNVRDVLKGVSGPYMTEPSDQLVSIGAYCLMPNHFHLLITPRSELALSLFMQKLATSYVMYFNSKYERTGGLFEGKFKAKHATEDRYLKYLSAYINLNPVKLFQPDWKQQGIINLPKTQKYLESYPYSSYYEGIGIKRKESIILNQEPFPVYFDSVSSEQQDIKEWLEM